MSPSRDACTGGGGESSSRADSILLELQEVLDRQLSLAAGGDLDDVLALEDRADELLGRLADEPPTPDEALLERLRRVGDLHRRLSIAVAQRKHELAEELARLRRGKTIIRAYGPGGRTA